MSTAAFDIEINRTPRKSKPAIQSKLENSPKVQKPNSPEELQKRILKANERRKSIEQGRRDKAHKVVTRSKVVAEKVKQMRNDENLPPLSFV
eukprot:TRINITY_DN9163_c0_g1_i1.p1 TRINITY_DN9163_c0_g1~~TRINITY_DN9163_c0_g1_i1.p1  ORF type:complete len:106 (-),score=24.77 TRINITY_DN9163_c0_g1_i1:41-316(-)